MDVVSNTSKHIRTFRSKKLHPEHAKLINEAIRKNARGGDHNVHISYTKADGTKSDRKVKPLAVKGKSLFVAHCHERNAIRSFKVERIDMIKKAFWDGFEKRAKVTLEDVEARMGAYLKPNHIDKVQRELDDRNEDNFALAHPILSGVPTLGVWPMSAKSKATNEVASKLMRLNPEYSSEKEHGYAKGLERKTPLIPLHVAERDALAREQIAKYTLMGTAVTAVGTTAAAVINALRANRPPLAT